MMADGENGGKDAKDRQGILKMVGRIRMAAQASDVAQLQGESRD